MDAGQSQVENLEYDFSTLDSFITPNDLFYVRNHYPYPAASQEADLGSWQLQIKGKVERPYSLNLDELRDLPATTLTATLECAGNHRSFLNPPVGGLQWGQGAVSNAEWTGVPLRTLLERAGIKPSAVEIIVEGADKGEVKTTPKPAGEIHFARSLPLDHPVIADTLLVYEMNGEPLSVAHGAPLRLVVPGWYAMASVKWVQRLVVTATPFNGYYQSVDYARWVRVDGMPTRVPITDMQPKAAIARPTVDEVLPLNQPFCMRGAAWSGGATVVKVEISADGGEHWAEAQLEGEPLPYAWRLWSYEAPAFTQPGRYHLMARATDSRGKRQPMQRDADQENYMISHVIPIPVTVQ
jgi:DMSO/TMAO reductase YedYZ molybdopterin-dependent catalytic subunit